MTKQIRTSEKRISARIATLSAGADEDKMYLMNDSDSITSKLQPPRANSGLSSRKARTSTVRSETENTGAQKSADEAANSPANAIDAMSKPIRDCESKVLHVLLLALPVLPRTMMCLMKTMSAFVLCCSLLRIELGVRLAHGRRKILLWSQNPIIGAHRKAPMELLMVPRTQCCKQVRLQSI